MMDKFLSEERTNPKHRGKDNRTNNKGVSDVTCFGSNAVLMKAQAGRVVPEIFR